MRLLFGISCAPEIFQRLLEQILNGCEGCFNYIDDILVFGDTKGQHDIRLGKVLERLKSYDITLNNEKCVYAATSVKFLGHQLSSEGIKPCHDKVASIKQFREPRTTEETRSFLGLVNYVAKFIPDLATITEPLRQLTRKGVVFEWGPLQATAFTELKGLLSSDQTLGFYNVNDRTQVVADASPVGLGGVLIQFNENGPRIISYASRSLSEVEKKYAQTEKEALALVWATERFHFYLYGREFELITDHKALETIFSPKSTPCARIERWALRLQAYKFKVIYKPGKSNIADPLSRLAVDTETSSHSHNEYSECGEKYVNWILSHAEPKAISLAEIEAESATDKSIIAVRKAICEDTWCEVSMPFKTVKDELCFVRDILLRGTRIVIPENLRGKVVELAHEGHPGVIKMKRRLRSKVWWPGMDKETETFIATCHGCVLVSKTSAPEPMRPTELPTEAWQHIAIDFCGPIPSGHYLFVVIDYYSRFLEVEPMTKIDSNETIQRLQIIFARFGFPLSITADNGRQFVSQEFRQYCATNNITLKNTTPYCPEQNGLVERQNRSILKALRICHSQKRDWREELLKYLLMYRSSPHSTLLKSPAELMFNRKMRDKLPCLEPVHHQDEELRDLDRENKRKMKEYADDRRRAVPNDIQVGDMVILKRQVKTNKLDTTFEPEAFRVTKRNGSEITAENLKTGTTYKRNVAHVKRVPSPTDGYGSDRNSNISIAAPSQASISLQAQPLTTGQGTSHSEALRKKGRKGGRQQTQDLDEQLPEKRKRTAPVRYQY